jgi:hypothetical protein
LGDGLLAAASTSSASTAPATSASTLAFCSGCRLARLLRVGGFFVSGLRFKLGFGCGRNFGLMRLDIG